MTEALAASFHGRRFVGITKVLKVESKSESRNFRRWNRNRTQNHELWNRYRNHEKISWFHITAKNLVATYLRKHAQTIDPITHSLMKMWKEALALHMCRKLIINLTFSDRKMSYRNDFEFILELEFTLKTCVPEENIILYCSRIWCNDEYEYFKGMKGKVFIDSLILSNWENQNIDFSFRNIE